MRSTVDVPQGELAYEVDGEGPSACLVHQYREVTVRSPLARMLTPHFRLHAINPVGLGGPSPAREDSDLSMEAFADDLEECRRELGLPPWLVVGSSTGGMVALLHALRHPKAVRGLILIGSAASHRFITGSLADPAHPRAAEVAAARALSTQGADGMAAFRAAIFRLSVADPGRNPVPPDGEDGQTSADRLNAFLAELQDFDLEPRLALIEPPTLVLVGRHDPQCPPRNSERMAAAIPGARLHTFEHSGHYPYLEEPDAFRAAINTWTRQHFG